MMMRIIRLAPRLLPFIALATIPFCILSLATAVSDLRTYSGVDLRPKVAGARLLVAGLDPYDASTILQQGEYFKSNSLPYYTPALLALYVPLSSLPFATQRTIYFFLDWLFAGLAFYLIQLAFCRTRTQKYSCWIVYAVFVLCSYSFRLHLERGQYYLLLLVLTCHAAASIMNNWTGWLSCIPSALLLVLRPTYALILLVTLISFGARKWTLRVAIIAFVMFLLTLQLGGIRRWTSYIHTIHWRQVYYLAEIANTCGKSSDARTSPASMQTLIATSGSVKHLIAPPAISGTLIGLSDGLAHAFKAFRPVCAALNTQWIATLNTTCIAIVLAGGIAVAFMARHRAVSPFVLIEFMVLWPLILELFSPERYIYTAVLLVLPLVLAIFDPKNFELELLAHPKPYIIPAIPALGLLPPVIHQLVQNFRIAAVAVSTLILLALPIYLAAVCVYSIAASPKRIEEPHLSN
jgi:hypothetical protein